MQLITRRGAMAAGSTLAALALARKPARAGNLQGQSALTPDAAPVAVPPLKLLTAEGRAYTIGSFVGQGVVLNLWATWCVPCVAEMPSLARLAGLLHDAAIAVVPLSSDRGGAAVVEKFYHDHDITGLPVWLDPDGDAVHQLRLRGIPTTLVIDRTGQERGRVEGGVDWSAADSVAKIKAMVG